MTELSFLIAHVFAVALLWMRRAGLEGAELAVGLAVLLPPLFSKAALLLPRLTQTQRIYEVGRPQKIIAWIAAALFFAATAFFVDQFARKDLLNEPWQLAIALAASEAVYGIYAAWFVQSRVIFNEREARSLREQLALQGFDVFLCHNSRDKPEVKALAVRLMERGIKPWLDEWELRPGLRWQPLLEEQIRAVKSAAVFVGADGIGPWQTEEIGAFLSTCVERGIPVIPVLLREAPLQPALPLFLAQRTWVDFRSSEPDPLERLVFGISGTRRANS
jgi:hypothetical protein